MGYILEKGFDLPPLMLTPEEIEAAVLGAQWVSAMPISSLARAAEDLMAKIADTVPERLRPFVLEPASGARPGWNREPDRIDMVRTRSQIHEGKKIALHYRDEQGRATERTIWPIAVGYYEAVRLLAGWCELRKDFRSFRTDRVIERRLSRREISRTARHPARALAAEPGLGTAEGYLMTIAREPAIAVEDICQGCGACCATSANWPRFSTEEDAALDLIPAELVNARAPACAATATAARR